MAEAAPPLGGARMHIRRQTKDRYQVCNLDDTYKRALSQCSRVAREEFRVAANAFQEASCIGRRLTAAVALAARRTPRDGSAIEDAKSHLQDVETKLGRTLETSLSSAEAALSAKKAVLGRFTVTLFGRTMAGKSTIREALTRGDGTTIGQGAQRTTRDVREYTWNSLRVIDTPGIGAYEGEEDRVQAMSVIDETDVVLFLTSTDGVQEEAFEGMRRLREQNKPMLFVLNVKRDLSKPVHLRRFLKDPESMFAEAELRGHFDRIRRLAGAELGMRDPVIIPIHAQAAYLSTRPEHEEHARSLAEYCRLGDLLQELESQVSRRGMIRRVQTIVDGTQGSLLDLQMELAEQAKHLRNAAQRLEDKFGELDVWMDAFARATESSAVAEAARFVQDLRTSISSFIDENIERDDVGERWGQKVRAMGVEEWLKRWQKGVLDELHGRLVEFSREMAAESELIDKFDAVKPSQCDPWDVRRSLRWTSAGAGAVASVAVIASWVGAANFWNPVGWIAGGVGIVALALSWCFGDRENKLQGQKAKAASQLRDSIDEFEHEISERLIGWFRDTVSSRYLTAIRNDTKRLHDSLRDVSRLLAEGAHQVGEIVEGLNRRLILRAGQFAGAAVDGARIIRLVRDPGIRTKFLWGDQAGDAAFCRKVGLAIGEWVDGIPNGPATHKVAWSLRPASVAPSGVRVSAQTAIVRLPHHEVGRAIGLRGSNVSLASRLLRTRIKVIGEDGYENG